MIRLVSCSRFSTKVCMGLTAWCSESISSGAVCLSPSVASSRAFTVDGPVSVTTMSLSWAIRRFSCAPPVSSLTRRLSVAAPTAARMPTEWSSRPRPVATSTSRSLLTVVWNSTVGSWVSSAICAPARIGAPGPRSTSCTEETAKTLLGTTRAVAVLGMDLAYCGLRLMCTKLG
ncbi:Uncharacterised protein [Mycobacteroides abscessus subsp. massiliense]|nr:Uncharacterised protein [Mycobacteroides abscessus subsp. massiliense]